MNVRVWSEVTGVEASVAHLTKYTESLPEKLRKLCTKLAEMGLPVLQYGFKVAQYDGTIDCKVGVPYWQGKTKLVIPVSGKTVAFVEFGTGVFFPDTHPTAARLGAVRGQYGHGRGKGRIWKYYGEPGTFGYYSKHDAKKKGLVTTHGNKANKVMYGTVEEMRKRVLDIAGQVF